MKGIFRVVAILEALSWLALFGSMYLKYIENMPEPNKYTGMTHGVLFLMYVVLALQIAEEVKWTRRDLLIVMIASVFPGATLYVERKMM